MTPTSEDRQEVAWKLRADADACRMSENLYGLVSTVSLADAPGFFQDIAHYAGIDGEGPDRVVRADELLDRLADLMDPTCHIADDDWASRQCMGPMLSCDRCGNAFPEINGPYQYCPCCGARVVSE